MVGEVVKYHNDLNTIAMRKWTSEEMNFFFAIVAKSRDKGTKLQKFKKHELAELANYAVEHNKRFEDTMTKLANNIMDLRYFERTKNSISYMALFQKFEVIWEDDLSDFTAFVRVSEDFEYILNKLSANFTQYELLEFTKIRSTYAKSAYRLFKQWRTIGQREFKIDEFKRLFDMPKYYQSCHIDRLVIKPILKELPQYFPNLKVKKVKSNKRGNPVIAYEFTWKPEKTSGPYIKGKFDKKKLNKKNQLGSIPDWSNPDYKNTTPKAEQEELERLKKERLAAIKSN